MKKKYDFHITPDKSQEYLDLWYSKMPKLEELRNLTYRLYQDSKVLRSFRFENKKFMREVMEEIHEIEYEIMNY